MSREVKGVSTKLMRTSIILILIPIFSIGIGIYLFGEVHSQYIEKKYGIPGDNFKYFPDSIQVYDLLTQGIVEDLHSTIDEDVDRLRSAIYLEEINDRLKVHNSYLVIKSEDIITYVGNAELYNQLDKMVLVPEEGNLGDDKLGIYIGSEKPVLIKRLDFECTNGEKSTAFVIIDVSQALPESESYVTALTMIIIIMIIATGVLIVLLLWRRVLYPLKKLQKSLERLLEGDYSTEIVSMGTVEVYQFAKKLDDVRLALKTREDAYHIQEQETKEMISNISHDLKTPITSIKGYAEGLVDGIAATDERREKYCKTILAKSNQLDSLIDELSLYSQVHRKHMMYKFENLNIKSYFDDCAEELAVDLENRGVEFIYQNYVNDSMDIEADSQHLTRVIQNIVNNSLKYVLKERPIISLRVTDEDGGIVIRIVDNGQGIPEVDIEHIFDRFYRSDQSRNSDTGGSGIGLAIVKEIVEAHGGEVWATSKMTVGTVIHIKLNKIVEVRESE